MKFRYTTTPFTDIEGRLIKRPLVEVTLAGPSGKMLVLALIDSGADNTLIRADYARVLGIPLDQRRMRHFIGIGSKRMPCLLAPITLQVNGFEGSFTITAGFIDSPAVDVLLGQADFFELFRIRFEKDRGTFELSFSPHAKNGRK
jgi:hypothetical protein